MSKPITAVILDGFHKGHIVRLPYHPTIKLLKPSVVMVDTCCGGDEMMPDEPEIIEYQECFRAVDQEVVMYSLKGKSLDFLVGDFPVNYSAKPWTPQTTLYYGYHDGFLKREDTPPPLPTE